MTCLSNISASYEVDGRETDISAVIPRYILSDFMRRRFLEFLWRFVVARCSKALVRDFVFSGLSYAMVVKGG